MEIASILRRLLAVAVAITKGKFTKPTFATGSFPLSSRIFSRRRTPMAWSLTIRSA